MKNILKKLALLAIPVLLWLAFFIAFEPNNYFGLKASATSSQPVARVRAYQQDPGTNLILGDSVWPTLIWALWTACPGSRAEPCVRRCIVKRDA